MKFKKEFYTKSLHKYPRGLQYIKNPSIEVQLAAFNINRDSINYIDPSKLIPELLLLTKLK